MKRRSSIKQIFEKKYILLSLGAFVLFNINSFANEGDSLKAKSFRNSYAVDYKNYQFSEEEMALMFKLEKLSDYLLYRNNRDFEGCQEALLSLMNGAKSELVALDAIQTLLADAQRHNKGEEIQKKLNKFVDENPHFIKIATIVTGDLVKNKKYQTAYLLAERVLLYHSENYKKFDKLPKEDLEILKSLSIAYCELSKINSSLKKRYDDLNFVQLIPVIGESYLVQAALLNFYINLEKGVVESDNDAHKGKLLRHIKLQRAVLMTSMRHKSGKEFIDEDNLEKLTESIQKFDDFESIEFLEDLLLNNLLIKPNDITTLTGLASFYADDVRQYALAYDLMNKTKKVFEKEFNDKFSMDDPKHKYRFKKTVNLFLFSALNSAVHLNYFQDTRAIANQLKIKQNRFALNDLGVRDMDRVLSRISEIMLANYFYDDAYAFATTALIEKQNQLLIASILCKQGRFDEALKYYESMVNKVAQNKTLKKDKLLLSFVYNGYVNCLYKLKKFDEMIAFLDKEQSLFADDSVWLNSFAYVLVEQNKELERAEKMLYSAMDILEKSKHDEGSKAKSLRKIEFEIALKDSLMLCFFKQNKYADALKVAESILKMAKNHDLVLSTVIYDHCADVYAKNNNTKKALKIWKRALQIYEQDVDYNLINKKITEYSKK
ncbi:hypothetical protein AAEX28_08940 [Lentisphaerota bacterium WC36G]|nr:hypothetical protein LJT99_11790 [Lentisphaerae bacterium WC36]